MLRVGLRAPKVGARFWLRQNRPTRRKFMFRRVCTRAKHGDGPLLAVEKTRCIEDAFFNEFCGFRRKSRPFFTAAKKNSQHRRCGLPCPPYRVAGISLRETGEPVVKRKAEFMFRRVCARAKHGDGPLLAVEKTRSIGDAFFNEFCGFRRKLRPFFTAAKKNSQHRRCDSLIFVL